MTKLPVYRFVFLSLLCSGPCGFVPPTLCAQQPPAPGASGPAISYDLPKDGEVTLGVFDAQGHLQRTILSGESRSQGKNTAVWNGLDQWGKPVPAGQYVLKGLYHPALSTDYVMTFGNPGTPPWPTSDGKGDWLSDEASPQAVASDGKWIFLGSPGAEKGSTIIALDEKGQRQWGVAQPFNTVTVSLAIDGDYLYALFSGPRGTDATKQYRPGGANAIGRAILLCLDKHTGHAAKFTIAEPMKEIATFPFNGKTVGLWDLRTQKSFSPENFSGMPRYDANDIGETTSAIGLAVSNHRVYLSMRDSNQISVLDAETAAKVDQIPVPAPAGLYAQADHSILAVSDKHVVRINPASKEIANVISAGLVAPRCVTVDAKGRIFVSDWGASFQVKVFSPSGAPLHTIGQEGGRPWVGPWKPNGMLVPTGVAIGGDGNLWVAEDDASPKRVSVWNPDSGALVKEYLGPAPYGGPGGVIDPKDPTDANGMGARFRLNLAAKTSTIRAIVSRRMDLNQPFAMNGAAPVNPGQRVLYRNGVEYQTVSSSDGIVINQRKGDVLVPVAAFGALNQALTGDGTSATIWDSDVGHRMISNYYPSFFSGHSGNNYTWTDTDGDGLVEAGEMQWIRALNGSDTYGPGTQPIASTFWGTGIGSDWSIYWTGAWRDQSIIFRLDVKGWTAGGAPIYDVHDSKPIVVRGRGWNPIGLFATSEGKVIATYSYEYSSPANSIECFDRDGTSLWAFAMPQPAPASNVQGEKDVLAQNVIGEFQVRGLGHVLGSWLWHANRMPYLFTDDGLYVSSLLEDSHVGPNAAWDESYKNYYQDPQGVPYILNGGSDAFHILRIDGLDQGGRFQQPYSYTQQDFAKAAAYRQLPVQVPAPKPILNATWAAQPPRIDGNLADWNMKYGAALQGAGNRSAQVALSRDASNLYLAYQVTKDRPFSNKGDNWQTLFLTGDCVDLMLSTDPSRGRQPSSATGDLRLLLSMYQGKPVAVLYRPVVSGTKQPVQLAAAQIDDIRQLPSAKVVIVPNGNSYSVEAAIPLKDLGLDATAAGTSLRGDVGVIFSDSSGNNRALRLYYYNKKTSTVSDLSTEATLQPAEWDTVQLPLGVNLLKDGGFEGSFAATLDQGWAKGSEKNGASAKMTADSPHSGTQSLMLKQVTPVVYSADVTAGPDYHAFIISANKGAGGGEAVVQQRVSVIPGHDYSFRFNYRADKMQQNSPNPGPNRGYSAFQVQVAWIGTTVAPADRYTGSLAASTNAATWKQLTNSSANIAALPKPYHAPAGAAYALVMLRLAVNAANDLSEVYVDDLEFVDITAGH